MCPKMLAANILIAAKHFTRFIKQQKKQLLLKIFPTLSVEL
jgi:hypothetical protein